MFTIKGLSRNICLLFALISLSLSVIISPIEVTAAQKVQNKSAKKPSVSTANKSKKLVRNKKQVSPYKAILLFDETNNKIITSINSKKLVPPASLTKILSMYVALDTARSKKIPLSTLVSISPKAAGTGGSRMGLTAGEKVPLQSLLMGMAISSGNDASIAVAEFIGGSESKFVSLMNKKAKAIGMKNSTFKNSSGLPAKGQYTTAEDMLALAKSYLKAYPNSLEIYHSHKTYSHRGHYTTNANPLLDGIFPGANGLKTGYVTAAGYNLIATAKRGNKKIIGVILGAPSSEVRAIQIKKLLAQGFEYTNQNIAQKNTKNKSSKIAANSSPKATSKKVAANSSKKTVVSKDSKNKVKTVADNQSSSKKVDKKPLKGSSANKKSKSIASKSKNKIAKAKPNKSISKNIKKNVKQQAAKSTKRSANRNKI